MMQERQSLDAFVDRCFLCAHWTWEVFESGVPVYSACRHPDLSPGREPVACANVARDHAGAPCAVFRPVILRTPLRLLGRALSRKVRRSGYKGEQVP